MYKVIPIDPIPLGSKRVIFAEEIYRELPEVWDHLCLVDMECREYVDSEIAFLDSRIVSEGNYEHVNEPRQIYDSIVQYECGLGRAFDIGSSQTSSTSELKCQENGQWTKVLEDCICK